MVVPFHLHTMVNLEIRQVDNDTGVFYKHGGQMSALMLFGVGLSVLPEKLKTELSE
jgi:hypothetical protein